MRQGSYPDIREKLHRFAQCEAPVSLFVMAGHAYELEHLGEFWSYAAEYLAED